MIEWAKKPSHITVHLNLPGCRTWRPWPPWPITRRHLSLQNPHCTKNSIYVFPEIKLRGLVPSSFSHVSVSDFYIFPGSVCLFGCRKIGRTILGIYKFLTDTWMWKLGDRTLLLCSVRPRSFIFGNTSIGTRHLYWILIDFLFGVHLETELVPNTSVLKLEGNTWYSTKRGGSGASFSSPIYGNGISREYDISSP